MARMVLSEINKKLPVKGKITVSVRTAFAGRGKASVNTILQTKLIFFIGLLLFVRGAFASISLDIPLDHPVYKNLDRLLQQGVVHSVSSYRPWTLDQFIEINQELSKDPNLQGNIDAQAIAHFVANFNQDKNVRVLPEIALRTLQSNSKPSPFLQTGAFVNPLINNHFESRVLDGGLHSFIEPRLAMQMGQVFALEAQPSIIFQDQNASGADQSFRFRTLYAKLGYRNLELSVGRIPFSWGQSQITGTLYNGRQKPMDMIRLQNANASDFPGFLSFLGKGRFTLFVARLDQDQVLPGNFVVGERLSISPNKNFELGMSQSIQIGGSGGPDVPAIDYPLEILGYRRVPEGTDFSNRNFVLDYRFRFPSLENLNFYGEFFLEDCCHLSFIKNVSNMTGISLPDLGDRFHTKLSFEYLRTTYIYNHHSLYTSGFIHRGHTLGNDIGADSFGYYFLLDQTLSPKTNHGFIGAFEIRQSQGYDRRKNDIALNYPEFEKREKRYRLLYQIHHQVLKNFRLGSVIGIEKLQNAQFEQGYNPLWYVSRLDMVFSF